MGFPGENLDVFKTHEDFPNGNTIPGGKVFSHPTCGCKMGP